MELYGRKFTKDELRERIGDISQLFGIKDYYLNEGRAKGVRGLDVKTGTGFSFTVLPDRAMDIAWMEKSGISIGFIGKAGVTNPKYYDPQGKEWLRGFFGGVLTTCGLTNVGPPDKIDGWDLGLHGRISNTPAEELSYETKWEDDNIIMILKGKMREAVMFSENLTLSRKITAKGGENKLLIEDEIINEGFEDEALMILYHMNFGYPLVSEESVLYAPVLNVRARDEDAREGLESYNKFEKPTKGYKEQVFFHELAKDEKGNTCTGIINESLDLGFYIGFNQYELPYMNQWKMMGQQDYVLGLEPGNCNPIGQRAAREKGELNILKAGEVKKIRLELGVLSNREEIQAYKNHIDQMLTNTNNKE